MHKLNMLVFEEYWYLYVRVCILPFSYINIKYVVFKYQPSRHGSHGLAYWVCKSAAHQWPLFRWAGSNGILCRCHCSPGIWYPRMSTFRQRLWTRGSYQSSAKSNVYLPFSTFSFISRIVPAFEDADCIEWLSWSPAGSMLWHAFWDGRATSWSRLWECGRWRFAGPDGDGEHKHWRPLLSCRCPHETQNLLLIISLAMGSHPVASWVSSRSRISFWIWLHWLSDYDKYPSSPILAFSYLFNIMGVYKSLQ